MCVVDYGDEPATVYREQLRKARKAHRCDACLRAIQPGERYLVLAMLFDGLWTDEKSCEWCASLGERFAREHHSGRPMPSYLIETLSECVSEGDEDSERWLPDLERLRAARAANRGAA